MSKITDILTNEKFLKTCSITFLTIIVLLLGIYVVLSVFDQKEEGNIVIEEDNPQALMLLIEFEDTVGINNFVYEMNERDIPGLLMVNAQYVEENCEFVKGLQEYDIEIAGVAPGEPFWDIPYEEQYDTVKETKERIEACTGRDMRVIGSRYFAYDENTLKVADALDIPYVFARGTTGAKATIYKADEYDAKIFSVSNVESEKWGSGSLCDYSYWAREGNPADFRSELFTAFEMYEKVSPVSHTYLGGFIQRWSEPYIAMFDELDIDWVTLDEFGEVDVYSTFSEIPVNREVQYTTPHPEIPLEQELGVDNPCAVVELSENETEQSNIVEEDKLVMFHNGSGTMCVEAVQFFEENDIEYVEYLNTEEDFNSKLESYKEVYGNVSEGVSTSYGYYPMIFYKGRAFSGFNEGVGESLLNL